MHISPRYKDLPQPYALLQGFYESSDGWGCTSELWDDAKSIETGLIRLTILFLKLEENAPYSQSLPADPARFQQ